MQLQWSLYESRPIVTCPLESGAGCRPSPSPMSTLALTFVVLDGWWMENDAHRLHDICIPVISRAGPFFQPIFPRPLYLLKA